MVEECDAIHVSLERIEAWTFSVDGYSFYGTVPKRGLSNGVSGIKVGVCLR